ncbi:Alpha- and gamma-adaptin-binding protein p34 [Trichoplax sp. H2]|nr:Alpha- and gamma-adaptin-binding protein p34 [Trichoplax sp. H2]|eukprot:RDD43888.1 Alpha- and gamma-adaptin-binding protein p34 [Trichoplax sp. H2]
MDTVNNVLLISLSDSYTRENIFKDFFEHRWSFEAIGNAHPTEQYLWQLKTKYYSASVGVQWTTQSDPTIFQESNLTKVFQALILFVDNKSSDCMKSASKWASFCRDLDLSVKIVACPTSEERNIECWSIENEFELVCIPANPFPEDQHINTDEENESFGISRILEALECCQWTCINSNDLQQTTDSFCRRNDPIDNDNELTSTKSVNDSNSNFARSNIVLPSRSHEAEECSDTGVETESFETLFNRMKDMKDYAGSLPSELRKEYAAKVAIAFWNAIGGSDEEINDT